MPSLRLMPLGVLVLYLGPAALSAQAAAGAAPSATRFVRLTPEQTGVTFLSRLDTEHPLSRLYHSGFSCGGVALGDVDGDGRPDLYVVGGPEQNRLYRQTGALRFEDVTAAAGVAGGDRWGAGAALADIDGDGDLDIYVCNYMAPNQLFVNQGDGRFVEEAAARGVAVADSCLVPTFCDYDRDGDLDLYLVTYRAYRPGGGVGSKQVLEVVGGETRVRAEDAKYYRRKTVHDSSGNASYVAEVYGRPDYLFRNDGGRFTDVTAAAGVGGDGYGLAATWWDYDGDGWPDLYVSNDFDDPDRLYHNNRDGTFSNALREVVPHTTWYSMGSDAADLNNDGRIDLFVADMSATTHFGQKTTMGAMNVPALQKVAGPPPQFMRNAVYLNTGTGRMLEAAFMLGLANTDWTWSIRLADFDNDGWVDAFVTNGMTRSFNDSDVKFAPAMLASKTHFDLYKDRPTRPEKNFAFHNQGGLEFAEVGKAWGLDHLGMSFGAAVGDLDADGDLDLVVANLDEPTSIYRNETKGRHWVGFRLRGTRSNRHGVGAVVRLQTGGGVQVRHMFPAQGLLSGNEPLVHFGLGGTARIDGATVTWPSGTVQRLEDVAVDRYHAIEEPKAATAAEVSAPAAPVFVPRPLLAEAHREDDYDDFAAQPLLPNRVSRFGPGTAWGDIDGDGDLDVYVGGANEQAGTLYRNEGGRFVRVSDAAIRGDRRCEDMGALFFDADGDGDQDLYVVTGGVRYPSGLPLSLDRLYLNDGTGVFTKAGADVLPRNAHSGSVVTACDFDRDGDLDLFVGGRVIRHSYPLAPDSRLLRNDGGRFTDVTDEVAKDLRRAGMVTSASWSDVDGDGWLDLLVTYEWGPVRVFSNVKGTFADRTETAGLAAHTGWWNGIAGRDLDGDGDIDFVATNFGLNTKYHASEHKPALLYYGDFEGKGTMRLVEAEFEDETLFPVRGKSCSSRAIPVLQEKFDTYKDFALADLTSIYSEKTLQAAHRFAATTLESVVLLNDGTGRFTLRHLPRLAQIAPAFGVVVTEVDGDGLPDVVLGQNFYGPQPETGQMDGGLGLLLRGRGDGTFAEVWPRESGLVVAADARSLTVADFDGDGRPDLLFAVNDGAPQAFSSSPRTPVPLTVQLRGKAGNPDAVGARVTVRLKSGAAQTAEVQAGGGYLAQSSPVLAFGTGGSALAEIVVRWPQGAVTKHLAVEGRRRYVLTAPD